MRNMGASAAHNGCSRSDTATANFGAQCSAAAGCDHSQQSWDDASLVHDRPTDPNYHEGRRTGRDDAADHAPNRTDSAIGSAECDDAEHQSADWHACQFRSGDLCSRQQYDANRFAQHQCDHAQHHNPDNDLAGHNHE